MRAEGGFTHDRGEQDAISIMKETEKCEAQRQDEVRHRREDAVTMEREVF